MVLARPGLEVTKGAESKRLVEALTAVLTATEIDPVEWTGRRSSSRAVSCHEGSASDKQRAESL